MSGRLNVKLDFFPRSVHTGEKCFEASMNFEMQSKLDAIETRLSDMWRYL